MDSALSGGLDLNLLSLFTPKWAALGTGLKPLSEESEEQMGKLPEEIVKLVVQQLPSLFGDYPEDKDVAPSAVMIAIFALLCCVSSASFFMSWSRGHKFYGTLGLVGYSLMKCIGFGLRIKWSKDVLKVPVAIASVVFSQVPILILCVLNMYYASRVFTWRHPQAGRSLWFRLNNAIIYCLVVGVIIMAILGTALPNLYYMTQKHYSMCQKVAEAASVLQLVYALSGVLMLGAAYMFKPGQIDEKFLFGNKNKTPEEYPAVVQPTWIEKYSPFYFVPKGAQQSTQGAIPLIPSAEAPAGGMAQVLNGETGFAGPKMKVNNLYIGAISIVLLLCSCFRCAAMFIHKERGGYDKPHANVVFQPAIFYVFYGAVEFLIAVFMLVTRFDLRFYRPDGKGGVVAASNEPAIQEVKQSTDQRSSHSQNNNE